MYLESYTPRLEKVSEERQEEIVNLLEEALALNKKISECGQNAIIDRDIVTVFQNIKQGNVANSRSSQRFLVQVRRILEQHP